MPRRLLTAMSTRWSVVFSAVALVASMAAGSALADKRVALIIGNSDYRSVARLDNPANDAKLMAKTLRGLGFAIVGGDAEIDLDKAHFDRALQDFGNQVLGADVALFYYAGHGVQVAGKNFLVPVEANPTKEADVFLQMIDTSIVLSQMEGSGTKLNIVLLDACRNNPFGGRGLRAVGGGLAQMQAPEGTLISYATQPGNVALDGGEGDSPYTKALAATVVRPGLGLFDTFNEVGLAVKQATGGQQQPWLSSSPIEGGFNFTGAPQTTAAATPPPAPVAGEAIQRGEPVARTESPAPKPADADQQSAPPASPSTGGQQTAALISQPAPPPPPPPEAHRESAPPASPSTSGQQQTAALNPVQAPAASPGAGSATADCDRLAASPIDPSRPNGVVGLEFGSIDVASALPACLAASAAEPDNPRLQFELGRVELKAGEPDKALALFRKAAAAGHAGAMNSVGIAYERGAGVARDMAEAMRWHRRSAEAGDSAAMHRLGLALMRGEGVKMDRAEALRWFRKSADAGNAPGMTDVGLAYLNGWGVPRDPAEAVIWLRKGAEAGGPVAMNQLGRAYLLGLGVARDPAEAVRWFRKAADAGNVMAMESLGNAYRNGVGVERNQSEAERWFAKARQ